MPVLLLVSTSWVILGLELDLELPLLNLMPINVY